MSDRKIEIITAVIPTRNRPQDLIKAVSSLLVQTRKPEELIIIDQSSSDESRVLVQNLFSLVSDIDLIYVLNSNIKGLVDAKRVAVEMAKGSLVCFLEDDVVLELNYVEQVEYGFSRNEDMVGCCGVVTNFNFDSAFYKILFHIFHRGIFADKRVSFFGENSKRSKNLIKSDKLSGGISAWRREIFSHIEFDTLNGFHMLEDIDFSTRVSRYLGSNGSLYINPLVKLEHNCSPINRDFLGERQRKKLIEYFIYFKKRTKWSGAKISFIWLLIGLFLEAIYQSFTERSILVLNGFFSGLVEGFKKKIIQNFI